MTQPDRARLAAPATPIADTRAIAPSGSGCACHLHRAMFAVLPAAAAFPADVAPWCDAAFETLVRVHRRRILLTCRSIVHDRADAEDVTQEVFLRILQGIATFRCENSFNAWLRRIALNCACEFMRQRETPAVSLQELADESAAARGPWGLDADDACELRRELAVALAELPPVGREVFALHVAGFTHREIDARLGTASHNQLTSARRRLQGALAHWAQPPAAARRRHP